MSNNPHRCLQVIHETVFWRKSQGRSPRDFISELSSVLLVNTDEGWFDWLVLLQAYTNYRCASRLYRFLVFYQTGMLHRATSGSGSLVLLVVSQQTSRRLLHAFRVPWLCYILLPEMLSRASSDSRSLCLYCWHWQIYWLRGLWIISHRSHWRQDRAMQVINLIVHRGVQCMGGARDRINSIGQYRYSPVF